MTRKSFSFFLACSVFVLPLLSQQDHPTLDDPVLRAKKAADRDVQKSVYFVVGCVAPMLGFLIGSSRTTPPPPQLDLLGKSPEYTARYTKTYTETYKRIRSNYLFSGCLTAIPMWSLFLVSFYYLI